MIEKILRRDRILVGAALGTLTLLAWIYMIQMKTETVALGGPTGLHKIMSCCGVNFPLTFWMWTVMMAGMMIPSAAPMILTFATVNRKRQENDGPYVPTAVFLGGYLAAWTAFSVFAAFAQWALFHTSLLNPIEQAVTPWLGGSLFILAGFFQLTRFKDACLTQCRSPLDFLTTDWREGFRGAFVMGWRHGLFCVGCCWMLMVLLFVAGVMNLVWVAVIAFFVLAEKILPRRRWTIWMGGGLCFAAGMAMILKAFRII